MKVLNVLRPPPLFALVVVLQFAFSIINIHGSGRTAKKWRKPEFMNDIIMQGGGGWGPAAKIMHWNICLSTIPQFWISEVSVVTTTHFHE